MSYLPKKGQVNSNLKREILIGVIVSLLTMVFLEPIWRIFTTYLLRSGNTLYNYILNRFVIKASIGYSSELIETVCIHIISIFSGFFYFMIMRLYDARNKLSKHLKSPEENNVEDTSEVFKSAEELLHKSKRILITSIIALILFISVSAYPILETSTTNKMNLYFESNLKIISVYAKENEIRELKGLWASMETYNDYKYILNKLEQIGQNYELKLKKMPLDK